MKKGFILTAACLLMLAGCKKTSPPPELRQQTRLPVAEMVEEGAPQPLGEQPALPPSDQLGKKVTFELAYRSITGKEDDLEAWGGWGFGSSDAQGSPFIDAVKKQTGNKLFISNNHFLKERQLTAIEYKDKEVLHVYFDLNADGQLSGDEVLNPVEVAQRMRRSDDTTVFMTPDFMVKNPQGQPTPFSVLLWVYFYGDNKQPGVTWGPLGLYEGTARMGDRDMKLMLFPDFSSQNYTEFARSRYALVEASHDMKQDVRKNTFSSIIVADSTFYRVVVEAISPLAKTMKVSLIEDKTPRGRIALDIQGQEDLKCELGSAIIEGGADKSVYLNIRRGMGQLPVGSYAVHYGSCWYGREKPEEYCASFYSIPAVDVKADQETRIQFGKPTVTVQAVEDSKRYNDDKQYKNEFPAGTDVYIDASFVGMVKETYSSFKKRVLKENRSTTEDVKARIKIVDDAGNPVADEELEYG